MSYRAKRELLLQIAPRYREASPTLKTIILDEFVAATGYARTYAIRLLTHPVEPKLMIQRPRPPQYGPDVQEALQLAWTAANQSLCQTLDALSAHVSCITGATWASPSDGAVPRSTPRDERIDGGSAPSP